ncbi:MAG TPA: hypothetical protein VF791_22195 [Pyrinomonadaceae bacterium]
MFPKLKIQQTFYVIFTFAAVLGLFFAPLSNLVSAQEEEEEREVNIIAKYNFDPKVNGFSFSNYGNKKHVWQDDLTEEDFIHLFGAQAACVTGKTEKDCVLKKTAETWMRQELEGMDKGHCEGMAATSLRFMQGKDFKQRDKPPTFQEGADTTYKLRFPSPSVENYIAYYFITQSFREVSQPSRATAEKGPAAIVKMLVDSMKAGNDPYSLGIYKYKNGEREEGHAVTPIAVEDAGDKYKIHIYDNNAPGETLIMTVEKDGKQQWRFNTSINPDEEPDWYIGDKNTKTLELTANSWRERQRFTAPFDEEEEEVEEESAHQSKNSTRSKTSGARSAEFTLNGDGDLLVTDGNGKRIGFDPKTNRYVNEIPQAENFTPKGGLGIDLPHYRLPFRTNGKPYTITISGNNLKTESDVDFTYTASGFSVGFDGIRLDPKEVLTMTVSPDGEQLSFTAGKDGETPEIYYSMDAADGTSYFVEVDGVQLDAGKTLSAHFDDETGKFVFRDNDGNEDKYDVDFERVLPNGTEQNYETDDIEIGKVDNYEMDFGKWDGKSDICFRDDDDGNGFANDECEPQTKEDNDDDPDDADDEADDEDSDIDNDGKLNDDDTDDDGDGIPDDKDTDDDNDGEPDTEDTDDNEDDGGNRPGSLSFQQWRSIINQTVTMEFLKGD